MGASLAMAGHAVENSAMTKVEKMAEMNFLAFNVSSSFKMKYSLYTHNINNQVLNGSVRYENT